MKNNLPKLDHVKSAVNQEEGNIPSPRSLSQNAFHAIKDPGSDE